MAAGEFEAHLRAVRTWSASVWNAWAPHHAAIEQFVLRAGRSSA